MAIHRQHGVLLGIGVLLLILTLTWCSRTTFQVYVPIEMTFHGGDCVLLDRPDWLNADHVERMKTILEEYDQPYRIRDGRLLISRKLKADRDLTANYTQKAISLSYSRGVLTTPPP